MRSHIVSALTVSGGSVVGGALCLAAVLSLSGCTTPRTIAPATATPVSKNRVLDVRPAATEVETARRMIEAGDYTVVIPRLLAVISKYPEADASLDARYWLAVAYHEIHSYKDAVEVFEEYLRVAPEGKYAAKATERIAEIKSEYEQKYMTADSLEKRVEELNAAIVADPANVDYKWELADLLWRRGFFSEAGKLYDQIVKLKPDYANHQTVTSRIEYRADGTYQVLTPRVLQQRHIAANPITVENLNAFQSGRDRYTSEHKYYVVTGQVVNQSDTVMYGVQVIVTIYGFGSVVYDTNTVPIGSMNPGETRAFSVRFSNFENIENIHRYEATVGYQR